MSARFLDEKKPVFEQDNDDYDQGAVLPSFDRIWDCNKPTGTFNALSLAFMMKIQDCIPEERFRTIWEMKQIHESDPDDTAVFIHALERMLLFDEAAAMKGLMRERFPDHCRVLIDLASEAAKEQDWQEVLSMLEGVSRDDLDDGNARHVCHLLGMSYYIQGDCTGELL